MPWLSVTKPKSETEKAPQDYRAEEKQTCLRYSYDPHKEHANHDYQTDWVTREMTSTGASERQDIICMWFVICSLDLASRAVPQLYNVLITVLK